MIFPSDFHADFTRFYHAFQLRVAITWSIILLSTWLIHVKKPSVGMILRMTLQQKTGKSSEILPWIIAIIAVMDMVIPYLARFFSWPHHGPTMADFQVPSAWRVPVCRGACCWSAARWVSWSSPGRRHGFFSWCSPNPRSETRICRCAVPQFPNAPFIPSEKVFRQTPS